MYCGSKYLTFFKKTLYITYISIRTTCRQNFSLMGCFLRELLPKYIQNWAQLCPAPKKSRGIRKVKLKTVNIQKLKLMDPQTMEQCRCYSLCENLCRPFGRAPGGNLGIFWAEKIGFLLLIT